MWYLQYWLDLEKPVCRQVGLSLIDPLLRFCVKFYTPDPAQLEEEFTRYLFCLQIKRDLSLGLLQCNDNTAALMASYIVQGNFIIAISSTVNIISLAIVSWKNFIIYFLVHNYYFFPCSWMRRLCDRRLPGSYIFINI